MKIQNFKKYLPSKKFQIVFGSLFVLIILFFVIFNFIENREKIDNKDSLIVENKTVSEIMREDTDGDGIADWEESLWGTDKNNKFTFGKISDSQYIQNKKEELNINKEINEVELTETDKFAREFFTAYLSLKNTEEIDQKTIQSFSTALGKKIVDSSMENTFNKKEVVINNDDTIQSQVDYYVQTQELYAKAQKNGLGDELNIISNGILSYYNEGTNQNYDELLLIGQSYQDFASDLIKISVPASLIDYHLNIVNSANNIGLSVINMAKVINDPIVGLSGLSTYERYNEDLINSVEELEKIILENAE